MLEGPSVVLVRGAHIAEVGPADRVVVPPGAEVLDCSALTLLPGLVDAHTHYGLSFPPDADRPRSLYELLLRAVHLARVDLLSGVTTARTLSERDFLDVAYRDAVERGWIAGPRTLIATRGLQPPESSVSVSDLHVRGRAAVRRAVRRNVAAGADVIKLYLTPGSETGDPLRPNFTAAEIQAAVDEAHRAGKPVAAHAHGGVAVDHAIDAGVDTLEHGLWLTREQCRRMAERGVWLIGTQSIRSWPVDESTLTPALRRARAATGKSLVLAREAGVRLAVGTDGAHGLMAFELACLVNLGLSTAEALGAGTRDAAAAIGLGSETGTLEVGKWADVIGVAGNPLEEIEVLRDVRLVVKGGDVWSCDGGRDADSSRAGALDNAGSRLR